MGVYISRLLLSGKNSTWREMPHRPSYPSLSRRLYDLGTALPSFPHFFRPRERWEWSSPTATTPPPTPMTHF